MEREKRITPITNEDFQAVINNSVQGAGSRLVGSAAEQKKLFVRPIANTDGTPNIMDYIKRLVTEIAEVIAEGDLAVDELAGVVDSATEELKTKLTMTDKPNKLYGTDKYGRSTVYELNEVGDIVGVDLGFEIVRELPEVGATNVLYFIPIDDAEDDNLFEEWVWLNKGTEEEPAFGWERIGSKKVTIDHSEYVKFTDYATTSKAGAVKINNASGIRIDSNGALYLDTANDSEIANQQGNTAIKVYQTPQAVKSGLLKHDNVEWTDKDKEKACETIGAVHQDEKKAVAIGTSNSANNRETFAHGFGNTVNGNFAYGSGFYNVSHADISHTEGQGNVVGDLTQVEVRDTGEGGHAEGFGNLVLGKYAHAGGANNIAKGDYSKSDGIGGSDWANPANSEVAKRVFDADNYIKNITVGHGISYTPSNNLTYFSEGRFGAGTQSFSDFVARLTVGDYVRVVHSDGGSQELKVHSLGAGYFYLIGGVAWGTSEYIIVEAHQAENDVVSGTSAGVGSHVSGYHNYARGDYQTVIGKYNKNKTSNLFEVGNGTDNTHRKNAFEVSNDNTAKVNGKTIATEEYVGGHFVAKQANTGSMNVVYGEEHSGKGARMFTLASGGTGDMTIPMRNANGQFDVRTPQSNLNVANKEYVDNNKGTKLYFHTVGASFSGDDPAEIIQQGAIYFISSYSRRITELSTFVALFGGNGSMPLEMAIYIPIDDVVYHVVDWTVVDGDIWVGAMGTEGLGYLRVSAVTENEEPGLL